MLNAKRILGFAAVAGCLFASYSSAAVKLPNVISDHMVLQREMAAPIWGMATPGEKVTVKFRDQEKTAEAGKDGKWEVKLAGLKAGGPDELTIKGDNSITIKDVLVGEVWLGSGQSNMQTPVSMYAGKDTVLEKLAEESYPKVHLINQNGKWTEATPKTIKPFSALLFSFGVPLQKELDVPVGLMVGAVGGTPSGAWLSPEQFDADPACKAEVEKAMATYKPEEEKEKQDKAMAAYDKELTAYKAAAAADPASTKPTAPGLRPKLVAPRKSEAMGRPGEMPGGRKTGYLYELYVKPYIPYAIRGVLWDQGESGTQVRDVDQYTLMGALIRGWRNTWGQGDFPFLYVQKPSGGGPALNPADPVTIASNKFTPEPANPVGDASYRALHIKISGYPNTYMVTASDLGPDTHPWNKSGYGARSTRVALGAVYGKKIEYYGPVYESFKIDGGKIQVKFTHVGQGLVAGQSEKLQGFAIAGEDKKFYWADAAIDGDTIVLHSDRVAKPVAVRYAWSAAAPWANLFNKDGLPAQAFRTDDW
ncbi:MAG TPA: sialate O-acetylesterase [Tepidisphaeraceae bacterium]|jgi:sialate O-acetylesterase|nr:sialate O-acetylesterase [Tepidisphaeraceae bacterium]